MPSENSEILTGSTVISGDILVEQKTFSLRRWSLILWLLIVVAFCSAVVLATLLITASNSNLDLKEQINQLQQEIDEAYLP